MLGLLVFAGARFARLAEAMVASLARLGLPVSLTSEAKLENRKQFAFLYKVFHSF